MSVSPIHQNLPSFFYEAPAKKGRESSEEPQLTHLEFHRERVDFSFEQGNELLQGSLERFEFNASFKLDDSIYNIHVEVEQQILSYGTQGLSSNDQQNLLDVLPEKAREKVETFLNKDEGFSSELSPENVSDNIFEFALSHFNRFLEDRNDNQEEREKFINQVKPAVEKGFDDALEILDTFLTDDVRDMVLETRHLTQDKLNTFLGVNTVV